MRLDFIDGRIWHDHIQNEQHSQVGPRLPDGPITRLGNGHTLWGVLVPTLHAPLRALPSGIQQRLSKGVSSAIKRFFQLLFYFLIKYYYVYS